MKFIEKIFGDQNLKLLKKYQGKVREINALAEKYKNLNDEELRAESKTLQEKLQDKTEEEQKIILDEILPEAFALCREAATRTLGERPYDVQLIGGMAIHEENIAEMRTGEGKTLVATLPAFLNALTKRGVHVITVNDYLARRDAVWMGQIYDFLGLKISVINQGSSYIYDSNHKNQESSEDKVRDEKGSYHIVYDFLRPVTRQEAYECDIVYGTNSEFGFDYLRDNIEYESKNIRQKNNYFAIIDEIDSILIDEARTPLIISAPHVDAENLYEVFAKIVRNFKVEEDYTIDEKQKAVKLTDQGIEKAERSLGVDNIYTEKGIKYVHHLETAVRAKAIFNRDKEYVVKDGQVIIVDEFTGRLQPSRRWSGGLHQAVEAKEGLPVAQESRTIASITYQNFFKMYKRLSGMTGTAKTSAEEFYKVYGLDVIEIPTNKPVARLDRNDLIFQNEKGKFMAITKKIKELNEKGQPILIGTVSIEKNELLSDFLNKNNIKHNILNAKNHEREAEIIADAGQKGAVTIATNMAGRGVDIKLGGVPFDKNKYEEVKSLGGLYVLGTERHEARRIDNQLRGRSGRQGDPGETQFFVSLEDSLMRVFASDLVKNMMGRLGIPEDEPIQNKMITRSLEGAQTKIEGFNFDARKHVLQYDDVLNVQRNAIYKRRRKVLIGEEIDLEEEIEKIKNFGGEEIEKIIKDKIESLGQEEFYKAIRRIILQSIDFMWIDHLETMDFIRSSISLRAYGQRDPLIEYKKESLRLYRELESLILEQIIKLIPQVGEGAFVKEEERLKQTIKNAKLISSKDGSQNVSKNENNINNGPKIGRNEIVTIEKDGKEQQLKFKKAEPFLQEGWQIKK